MVDLNELKALLDRAAVLDGELAGVADGGVDVSGLQTKVAVLEDDVRAAIAGMSDAEVAEVAAEGQVDLDGWLAEYGTDTPDDDDEGGSSGTDFDVSDDEPDDTDLPAADGDDAGEGEAAGVEGEAKSAAAVELEEMMARRLALELGGGE